MKKESMIDLLIVLIAFVVIEFIVLFTIFSINNPTIYAIQNEDFGVVTNIIDVKIQTYSSQTKPLHIIIELDGDKTIAVWVNPNSELKVGNHLFRLSYDLNNDGIYGEQPYYYVKDRRVLQPI